MPEYWKPNKVTLEPPSENYFKLSLTLLRILGHWPWPFKTVWAATAYMIYRIFMMVFTTILFTLSEVIDTVRLAVVRDFDALSDNMSFCPTHVLGTMKAFIIIFNYSKIRHYSRILEQDVFKYENAPGFEPEIIIRNCTLRYKIADLGLLALCAAVAAGNGLNAHYAPEKHVALSDNTTTVQRALPYHTWFPYDTNVDPAHQITTIYQQACLGINATIIVSFDTVFVGLMIHSCGQLKILNLALRHLRARAIYKMATESSDNKTEKNGDIYKMLRDDEVVKNITKEMLLDPNDIDQGYLPLSAVNAQEVNDVDTDPKLILLMHEMLGKCVKHHEAIINLVNDLEDIYAFIILLQFGGSCIMLCVLLFQSIANPINTIRFFAESIYFFCLTWELGMYCWYGNEVMVESTSVSDALYESNWLGTHRSYKSTMLIMMARATRRVEFTAGKFVPLNLATFVSILRGSYAYYSFLNNFTKPKQQRFRN